MKCGLNILSPYQQKISFSQTHITIGKSDENHLQLLHPTVSRKHAIIMWEPESQTHLIRDIESTNGTFVNDAPVRSAPLHGHDKIKIGDILLEYEIPEKLPFLDIKKEIQKKLFETFDSTPWLQSTREELTASLKIHLEALIKKDFADSLEEKEIEPMISLILSETLGLGPLEKYLQDPDVTEIMINGSDSLFIEKKGSLHKLDEPLESDQIVRTLIDKIITPTGRRIDEAHPMVDARLPNGSRVNAILPPVCLTGPILTIRKFKPNLLTLSDLISQGTLTAEMADYCRDVVQAKKNIVILGGTGAGKTTFLNALAHEISTSERIITLEDAAELKLLHPHVVRLESRPNNIEGKGEITLRQLFRNALRMRPDRIIVGECRGDEVMEMLQAMNTGHNGSLTTCHANSPREVLYRFENMICLTGLELPIKVIREQLAQALDCLIHISRLPTGERKVVTISEVCGIEGEIITLKDIFLS